MMIGSHPSNLEHLGEFRAIETGNPTLPVPSPEDIHAIEQQGYIKLGYAFGIRDPLGRVFAYQHKSRKTNGVANGEWGIPSETVKGRHEDGILVQVETIEETLVRCLSEEQSVELEAAPSDAKLLLTRARPLSVIDWEMDRGRSNGAQSTFGIAIALSANLAMAEFIANTREETNEAEGGFFQSLEFLQERIKSGNARSGMDAWLGEYLASTITEDLMEPLAVEIPQKIEGQDWRSLRFKNLGSLALVTDQ